jgi:hypothetical protein
MRKYSVDIKADWKLLQHANSRITLDIYQQAIGVEKRMAPDRALRGLLEERYFAHSSTLRRVRKKRSRPQAIGSDRFMAGTTGLEPATSAVTGQRSDQLSYVPTRTRET